MQMGIDAHVLRASSYDSERLMRLLKRDSWFRINDTVDFANAVSCHVPGFRSPSRSATASSPTTLQHCSCACQAE